MLQKTRGGAPFRTCSSPQNRADSVCSCHHIQAAWHACSHEGQMRTISGRTPRCMEAVSALGAVAGMPAG